MVTHLLILALMIAMLFLSTSAKADNEFKTTTISEVYIPSEKQLEKEKITDSILFVKPFEINYKTITWEEYQKIKQQEQKQKIVVKKQTLSDVAQIIWNTFKSWGWSNAVSAGVLGNIMAEVGGHSLNINPYLYGEGGSYYGMCQWSIYYFPEVNGADIWGQLERLKNTISKQLKGYGYENFLATESAAEAAWIFAKYYERCASWSYAARQRNAQIAYASFVG